MNAQLKKATAAHYLLSAVISKAGMSANARAATNLFKEMISIANVSMLFFVVMKISP